MARPYRANIAEHLVRLMLCVPSEIFDEPDNIPVSVLTGRINVGQNAFVSTVDVGVRAQPLKAWEHVPG